MIFMYSYALKFLAIYSWSFTPTFILSLLPQRESFLGEIFIREDQVTGYQFELLFAMIFFVWGIYLWKASAMPQKYSYFINFTLVTTFVHILWMLIVAVIDVADRVHLLRDALVLGAIFTGVLYCRWRDGKNI